MAFALDGGIELKKASPKGLASVSCILLLPANLAQQRQRALRQLVCLGENRGAGLLQDLVFGHTCHFCGVVGILDA